MTPEEQSIRNEVKEAMERTLARGFASYEEAYAYLLASVSEAAKKDIGWRLSYTDQAPRGLRHAERLYGGRGTFDQPTCECHHPERVFERELVVKLDGSIFVDVLLTPEEWDRLDDMEWPDGDWPEPLALDGADVGLSAGFDSCLNLEVMEAVFPEKRPLWDECRFQAVWFVTIEMLTSLPSIATEDGAWRVIH